VVARTRCSSQHHAPTNDSPAFLVRFHRCTVRVGSGTGFLRFRSLENGSCGRFDPSRVLGARNAGASQSGDNKIQAPRSHFGLSSPTSVVSVTRAVIPVPKASLNIWNWREVDGMVGCEWAELCKGHICGGRQKIVSRDIRASRIKLIARRVPIR